MTRPRLSPARLAAWIGAALVVAGCSSTPEKPKPRPLEPLTPQNVARQAWTLRTTAIQFPMTVALARGVATSRAARSSGARMPAER